MNKKILLKIILILFPILMFIGFISIENIYFDEIAEYFIILIFIYFGLICIQFYIFRLKNRLVEKKILNIPKLEYILIFLSIMYSIGLFLEFYYTDSFNTIMSSIILFSLSVMSLESFIYIKYIKLE